jgi:hypothetical protein
VEPSLSIIGNVARKGVFVRNLGIRVMGLNISWNTTIKGKSYAKNLKLGPELEKYVKETGHYRDFLRLGAELVGVNERICELRPVREVEGRRESEELKKNYWGSSGRDSKRGGPNRNLIVKRQGEGGPSGFGILGDSYS